MQPDRFTHIKISRHILIGAATAFLLFGCNRTTKTAPPALRITVQEIVTDNKACATLLTIHSPSAGSISVDMDPGDHSSVVLSGPDATGSWEGSVVLMASRIEPSGDDDIYIQTLIRPQTPNGASAGGPSTYTLPRTTKLHDHFTITAKSGDFAPDTPIEIAQLGGKPVTLTVGKPTK
jgi:hypothetical protein